MKPNDLPASPDRVEGVFARNSKQFRAFARRLNGPAVRREADTTDIMQSAIGSVLAGRLRVSGDEHLRKLIMRAIRCRAIDKLRKGTRREVCRPDIGETGIVASEPDPALIIEEKPESLASVASRICPGDVDAEIMHLRALGHSYEVIASTLNARGINLTANAVALRLHRIRHLVSAHVGEETEG